MFKSRLFWKVLGNFSILLVVLAAITALTLTILTQIERHFSVANDESRHLITLQQINKYISETPVVVDDFLFSGRDSLRIVHENTLKEFDAAIENLEKEMNNSNDRAGLDGIRKSFHDWVAEIGDKKIQLRSELIAGHDACHLHFPSNSHQWL